jgi:hypothetical protein
LSSEIRWNEQSVWVANRVLDRLFCFAEEVGKETARDADESTLIHKWIVWKRENYFPGICVDLEEIFPHATEKKLWARVFSDVARRIFLRELGLHERTFWQSETIAVAWSISDWLTRAIQIQSQEPWHPETENSREASAWHGRNDR